MRKILAVVVMVVLVGMLLGIAEAGQARGDGTAMGFYKYGASFDYWLNGGYGDHMRAVVKGVFENPFGVRVERCEIVFANWIVNPFTCLTYVMPEWGVWYQEDATFPEAYWDVPAGGVVFRSESMVLLRPNLHVPFLGPIIVPTWCPDCQSYP